MKQQLKVLGAVAIGAVMVTSTAFAAEFLKPADSDNSTITLPASETHHNVYMVAGNISVVGKVTGDLVAAGGMIKVTGDVEDDVILAGGNLDVSGKIGGNARLGGGNVSVNNSVGSDLLVGGGNIVITDTASIAGDFVAGGGNVDLSAPVGGIVRIAAGSININSTIKGDVFVTASKKVTFGPKAVITGKITYYGNSDPIISAGAQISTIDRHALERSNFHHRFFSKSLFGAGLLIMIVAWLLAGLLLMYLLKPEITKATMMMRSEPWANLGIGLISLIVAPILFVLLLITIVGYYIAFLILFTYLMAAMIAGLVGAIFLGQWLYGYIDKNTTEIDWKVVLTGVVAYKLLSIIPIIGWLIIGALCLTAFGAILRLAKHQMHNRQ